jgi:hypothetical protein
VVKWDCIESGKKITKKKRNLHAACLKSSSLKWHKHKTLTLIIVEGIIMMPYIFLFLFNIITFLSKFMEHTTQSVKEKGKKGFDTSF